MQTPKMVRLLQTAILSALPLALSQGASAAPPSLATIYDFPGGVNGSAPTSGFVSDKAGNLYGTITPDSAGTAACSDAMSCGFAYELSPPTQIGQAWTLTVLNPLNTGNYALEGGLARDPSSGTLFGMTVVGGGGSGCGPLACGTVFELVPPAAGQTLWVYNVIYRFANDTRQGAYPSGTIFRATDGTFYGTTAAGGGYNGGVPNSGTVFHLLPPNANRNVWLLETNWDFQNGPDDGRAPLNGVIVDATGAVYGTTSAGPASPTCGGSIFKLVPSKNPIDFDTFTNLYHFVDGIVGCTPTGPLYQDGSGVLYGTTNDGGLYGAGAVYTLTPPAAGQTTWTAAVIHSFMPGNKGSRPNGGVIADTHGKLYGTTAGYATQINPVRGASVFELAPPTIGESAWTWKKLATFDGANGASPMSSLVIGHNGKVYGTTKTGGANQLGTAFELTR